MILLFPVPLEGTDILDHNVHGDKIRYVVLKHTVLYVSGYPLPRIHLFLPPQPVNGGESVILSREQLFSLLTS